MARKRVFANPPVRASDGSAYMKCKTCQSSVAVALFDMHECETKRNVKRFRGVGPTINVEMGSFSDQPRSPFCFFMESFRKTCNIENVIGVDRKGFETWKTMSIKEKCPYVLLAEKVNSTYLKALAAEENSMLKVDDEADSAMVGKYDDSQFCESDEDDDYLDYRGWGGSECFDYAAFGSKIYWDIGYVASES